MKHNMVALREGFSALDKLQLETMKNLMDECSITKCSNCPVLRRGNCTIGKTLPNYNSEQQCPVPLLQAKSRVYGIEVIDENVIMKKLQDIFKVMTEWSENPRDCKYMMDCLMKIKEEYYPSVKQNLNINMDIDVRERFMKFYDEVVDSNNRVLTKDNTEREITYEEIANEV